MDIHITIIQRDFNGVGSVSIYRLDPSTDAGKDESGDQQKPIVR